MFMLSVPGGLTFPEALWPLFIYVCSWIIVVGWDSLDNNKYTHIIQQTQLSLGFESFWVNQRQQFIKRERSSCDLNPFVNHPLRHDVAINLQNICINYKSLYVTIIV